MVTRLKCYNKGTKGLLVFTHKERHLFKKSFLRSLLFYFLKKKYFLTMHWGHYHSNADIVPYVDFHMAGEGTLKFRKDISDKVSVLHLCSRNFVNFSSNEVQEKVWDILMIARPIHCKKIKEFFLTIKKLYSNKKFYKVLIVCSASKTFFNSAHSDSPFAPYKEIQKDFNSFFNDEEKKFIKLDLRADDNYPFSFTQNEIKKFYATSKIFSLFSEQEGESRVISEALWFGLPVVAWKHLRGGGLDYLDETNSVLFDKYDDAYLAFEEILANIDKFIIKQETKDAFSSEKSLIRFNSYLNSLYQRSGFSFTGLDVNENLDKALPGHLNQLDKKITNEFTDDLNSFRSFISYVLNL